MAAIYTVKQVADILGYSTNSIYTFLKEKRIKGIRVGTGRFRIPQSELDRLLMITKKQQVAPAAVAPVGIADVTGSTMIERSKLFGFVHLGTLNIFDWFIGVVAVISGLTLFLFATFTDRFGLGENIAVIPLLRIFLVGGGIGVLATNITGQTHRVWHKLFHVFISVSFIVFALNFWRAGELEGVLTFSILSVLVFASTVIHIGGAAWMSLYISALTVTAFLSIIFSRSNIRLMSIISQFPVSQSSLVAMTCILSVLFLGALWYGYKRNRQVFMIVTWVAALWYFIVAFWYATDNYWTRSFFFLVMGMASLFLSPWESLVALRSRKADLFTLGVFGGIFVILALGITGVYLMQVNIVSTVEEENVNKVQYAKDLLETTITDVKATIEGTSSNSAFTDAVVKKDLDTIAAMERIMFDSNNAIRRLVVLDRDGQGINLYPYGTFDEPDFSERDYFIRVRDSGETYVSDLFEARSAQDSRLVVSVATPLFTTTRVFAGVLVASLNLEGIGARLQKVAVPMREEYFLVLNSQGLRIIDPDSARIGQAMEEGDPMLQALTGGSSSFVGSKSLGEQEMVTYDIVDVSGLHWAIALRSPTAKLYDLADMSNLSIFSLVVTAVIIAGAILSGGFFWRQRRAFTGGSP